MGGQNFVEHFILQCVDVHALGQHMTTNNPLEAWGQMCLGEFSCS